jgi:multiple sugar transport system permease protein
MIYPLYSSVNLSLHATTSSGGSRFVGLANFRQFFHDKLAWTLVVHSYIRGVGGVVPSYLVGLAAALALNQRTRLNRLSRVLVLLPLVIFGPVAVNIWKVLIDPLTGIPQMLGWHVDLLGSSSLVWPTLLGINTWASFQFYALILLAGLSRIPSELYEAATIDGAGAWSRFRWVTMPGIVGISVVACVIHFILSYQEFNLVYLLTGGGPSNRTQILSTYAYSEAFANNDMGYASAISLIGSAITVITLAAAFLVVRAARWGIKDVLRRNQAMAATLGEAGFAVKRSLRLAVPLPSRRRRRRSYLLASVGRHLWVLLFVVVSLAPMLVVLSRSFDISPDSAIHPTLWPRHFSVTNYKTVLTDPGLWGASTTETPALAKNVINSLIVSGITTVLVVVVALMAGFVLSRWRNRMMQSAQVGLLGLQLVPVILWVFPLYGLLISLHLLGSRTGQILTTSVLFIPIGTLFFRAFFDELPKELDEAAAIDGAGPMRILFFVLRPLAKPVIGAVAAYTVINSWNEYLFATTFVEDNHVQTLPPVLQTFMSSISFNATYTPGVQAVFFVLPILIAALLLALTQRQLAAAYEGGALKG